MFLQATLTFTGTTRRVSQVLELTMMSKISAIITADISAGTWNAGFEVSNDGTVWVDLDTAAAVVDTAPQLLEASDVACKWVRVVLETADAGTLASLTGAFYAKL